MDDVQLKIAKVFSVIAAKNPEKQLRIPQSEGVTRRDVSQAFQHAFEMIGGVSRFSLWADQNPTEFYRLYSRMLPPPKPEEIEEKVINQIRRVLIDAPSNVIDIQTVQDARHSDAESV
jgi:hypothetical protein